MPLVITDSSILIGFEQIGHLHLLPETITAAMEATFGNGDLVPDIFPVTFHFAALSCICSG